VDIKDKEIAIVVNQDRSVCILSLDGNIIPLRELTYDGIPLYYANISFAIKSPFFKSEELLGERQCDDSTCREVDRIAVDIYDFIWSTCVDIESARDNLLGRIVKIVKIDSVSIEEFLKKECEI